MIMKVNKPLEIAEQISKAFNYLVMENPYVKENDKEYQTMTQNLSFLIMRLHSDGGIPEDKTEVYLQSLNEGRIIIEENRLKTNEFIQLGYDDILNRLNFAIRKLNETN
ncbi:hypothetical protein CON36_31845 [Bacillus cereus]|uniref:Uncharacterized protein n=1 Tax=Bacillus cereus TaxID=1396 RepID=A0A9X6STA0_BACCE|nr:hypothetical protein [Bacillus cereus]PDZ94799.1 hypothetical protein CON36_31845 [Bacillus cereus]